MTSEPPCAFLLGFAQLQAQISDVVGACAGNERPDAQGSSQRTTNGLLVWRASDGALGFTDGHRTWARGPDGAVYVRTNDERFPWEAAAPGAALRLVTPGPPAGTTSTPVPAASPVPPTANAQTPPAPPAAPPAPRPPVR